jgi:glutamyl-tRNA reductase
MALDLYIVGLSHHTAPVEVRERLALENGAFAGLLEDIASPTGVHETVLLSTCNRVEVVTCCETDPDPLPELERRLMAHGGLHGGSFSDHIFRHRGREAVRHVFRVASSLDSMVVGEPQILGQLKEQYAASAAAHAAGPILNRVFHKSFSVAKRVRNETGVASRAVSVASVAADLAGRIFEDLSSHSVLLLGAGEIGEAAATNFQSAGVGSVMVANRTFETAVELAREFDGTPIPFERIPMYLPLADLVVGSAGGGELVDAPEVRRVMRERLNKPMFFIDLAVPRNFDPAINTIDDVYLYDVDDLTGVVEDNLGERKREAIRGEAIVEREVDRFWQWFERLDVVPTIVELRALADTIRSEELSRTLDKIEGLSEADRDRVEQMTQAIVNKLLHEPTSALTRGDSDNSDVALFSAARELFGLGKKS